MANRFGSKSTTDDVLAGVDLRGRRVLLTGTSAGLGVETARVLVAHGAEVVGVTRDLTKGERATEGVREAAKAGSGSFRQVQADLGSLASVRAAADRLVAEGKPFDAILANAGVMATPEGKTADGFETQFGTNHLGHFVLTNRLLPLLQAGARIVNLSSSGHRFSNVVLDDVNFDKTAYDPWQAYGRSKTANILFVVELDRRLKGRGIRATAVHPGGIQTELGRHLDPSVFDGMLEQINREARERGEEDFSFKSIPQGAATTVWAGFVAPAEAVGGRYAEDCSVSQVVADNAPLGMLDQGVRGYALDPVNAAGLWAKSEELVGERF